MSHQIDRVDAITKNARATWFALLSLLLFVGVTLMSVEHIDFYGVGRATQLPLVNVTVPTFLFFYAAPLLTAAVYIYFHLYLIRLWDALSTVPARQGNRPVGDQLTPWLLNDAALYLRTRLRQDSPSPTTHRMLEGSAALFNLLLAWGFGLLVLFFLWWQSMPARDIWMTTIAGLSLLGAALSGFTSFIMLLRRMKTASTATQGHIFKTIPALIGVPLLVPLVLGLGYARTESTNWLARVAMPNQAIVERPEGWLPYQVARDEALDAWCRRKEGTCTLETPRPAAFDAEWETRRNAALAEQTKPRWHREGARKPNWRGADLRNVYLSGADLRRAQMERADLSGAQMEGADLFRAQMEGADLSGAQMEKADLISAQMEWADLSGAQMEGADLRWAQMEVANLFGAQMEGADLSFSRLTGSPGEPNLLQSTNLVASVNNGGAMRFVDLTEVKFDARTDFRNTFIDGSTAMTPEFRTQMGGDALEGPCQWSAETLSHDEFYARWRGWVEHPSNPEALLRRWASIAPRGFADVTPIPPPPGCEWKTGPMPGAVVAQ